MISGHLFKYSFQHPNVAPMVAMAGGEIGEETYLLDICVSAVVVEFQ